MVRKIICSLIATPTLVFSQCDMPYTNCEIKDFVYHEYVQAFDEMGKVDTESDIFIFLQGYSSACLHIYMHIIGVF